MSEPSHNINGAGPYASDPREQTAWDNYVKRGLENAKQSAIDAGYSEDSAINITARDWFKERLAKLKRKDMLSNAEKVLDRTLKYSVETDDGSIKTDLLRTQVDVAKHITKTLGKDVGYSERIEQTAKDGANLISGISDEAIKLAHQINELRRNSKRSVGGNGDDTLALGREASN